jgi:hypothetical protein
MKDEDFEWEEILAAKERKEHKEHDLHQPQSEFRDAQKYS